MYRLDNTCIYDFKSILLINYIRPKTLRLKGSRAASTISAMAMTASSSSVRPTTCTDIGAFLKVSGESENPNLHHFMGHGSDITYKFRSLLYLPC